MKAIIYLPRPNAKRIKVMVPYEKTEWRKAVKAIQGSWWHPTQKLWSVVNTQGDLNRLNEIFGEQVLHTQAVAPVAIPHVELDDIAKEALQQCVEKLTLKGYSHATIKSYRAALVRFFSFFKNRDIEQLTKNEIENYMYLLISKYKVSESSQNVTINAIKAYYEHVLGVGQIALSE